MLKTLVRRGGIVLVVLIVPLLLIQAIPYGRDHSNPPLRQEPAWDSPETRTLAVRACFACHSNEVDWPWYSNIAPFSWLIQRDVDAGRDELNFSEWDRQYEELGDLVEVVDDNEMPPKFYRWFNSEARLSSAEREALIQGLEAMFGRGVAGEWEDKDEHEEEDEE